MPRKTNVDPIAILRKIAADPNAGSTARVQACKALIQFERDADDSETGDTGAPKDVVTQRALRLLKGGKS